MLFVRGIMGNLKLNPAIKLWGGLAVYIALILGGLVLYFADFEDAAEKCEAQGGMWVGGAVPARFGMIRSVGGFCAEGAK